MRISYAARSTYNFSLEDKLVCDAIRTRRGLTGLLPLDHALLHSVPIASGWNELFSAIRQKTTLSSDILFLAICRVALHCGASIPWKNYLESLRQLDGVTNDIIEIVEDPQPAVQGVLSDKQWAALRYADIMTKQVAVNDSVFQLVKAAGFTERQIVELTITIAAYACVSRFLLALDIDEKEGV
ncbi:hypothetical protein H2200_005670 [Cladophialophora chaetospira]|uniref:Carboxymuconolactone decarboxylase n=1 Tax=Cladophialophora chaetospira TaxID=386627 RepID=A0AA39CHU0_9EURO|nr:hypothetical protein H2200_005670 [Cladophialophora chaetospira]